MDYHALGTELSTDPLTRGYGAMSDLQAANDLNTVYRTIARDCVFGWEIFNATDDTEYDALTDAQKESWDRLCAIDEIDTASGVAKAREKELFGAGTTTRTNLQAVKNEDVSRAEELDRSNPGPCPVPVRESDVAFARTL